MYKIFIHSKKYIFTICCPIFGMHKKIKFLIKIFKNEKKIKLKKSGSSTLSASDLNTLGPCFAPNVPIEHFKNISATDFYSSVTYFQGIQFQPNSTWVTALQTKIS